MVASAHFTLILIMSLVIFICKGLLAHPLSFIIVLRAVLIQMTVISRWVLHTARYLFQLSNQLGWLCSNAA